MTIENSCIVYFLRHGLQAERFMEEVTSMIVNPRLSEIVTFAHYPGRVITSIPSVSTCLVYENKLHGCPSQGSFFVAELEKVSN